MNRPSIAALPIKAMLGSGKVPIAHGIKRNLFVTLSKGPYQAGGPTLAYRTTKNKTHRFGA